MIIRFFLIICTIAYCLSIPAQTINNLTAQEKKDGWDLLFDGTSLHGWHTYNSQYAGSEWDISGDAIHLADKAKPVWGINKDLVSDAVYKNFDLKLEWKISANGNSGIMFWVQEDPANNPPYFTGPEMQVLDDYGNSPNASIPKQRAGEIYNVIEASQRTTKHAGEWNEVEIVCQNDSLKLYQNGVNIITTVIGDDNWRNMVTVGYGNKRPMLGLIKQGKIDLQDAGDEVWYRNIKIKNLNVNAANTVINAPEPQSNSVSTEIKSATSLNDSAAFKVYMNTNLAGEDDKYNYLGDWALTVDADNNVTGLVSWLLTLKQDPGISLQKNNFRLVMRFMGTYDKKSKKITAEAYEKGTYRKYKRIEIFLEEQDKVAGKMASINTNQTINSTIDGVYQVYPKRKSVFVNNSKPQLVGRWICANTTLLPKPLVGSVVEFFDNGAGLSKTSVNPDYTGNLKFFDWSVNGNDLYLSGNKVMFAVNNDQLKIGNTLFKKATSDPLQSYKQTLPVGTGLGEWIVAAFVIKDKMYFSNENILDPQNIIYDLHPLSNNRGEIISFSNSAFTAEINWDSLTVIKYGPLKDVDPTTTYENVYALDGLSKEFQGQYDFRFQDIVGVMHSDEETVYLVRIGDAIWPNLDQLHNSYNAFYMHKILPPPGTHWVSCIFCGGTGKIDGGSESVYDHTNQNGYGVDQRQVTKIACPHCYGDGGNYVDDETGNPR